MYQNLEYAYILILCASLETNNIFNSKQHTKQYNVLNKQDKN